MELLQKYQDLARAEERVIFGGRLGSYQYLDMDDAVARARQEAAEDHDALLPRGSP